RTVPSWRPPEEGKGPPLYHAPRPNGRGRSAAEAPFLAGAADGVLRRSFAPAGQQDLAVVVQVEWPLLEFGLEYRRRLAVHQDVVPGGAAAALAAHQEDAVGLHALRQRQPGLRR